MTYVRTKEGDVYETATPDHWVRDGAIALGRKEGEAAMQAQSIKRLRGIVRPGDTVYCVLRHVSASGMSRRIDLYAYRHGAPVYLSGHAARAIGWKLSDKGGIIVGGCGMDMGFHLVYALSSRVWPRYRCRGKRKKDGRTVCPSNYHNNHRLWLHCPGVERDGRTVFCGRPSAWRGEELPADWPTIETSGGRGIGDGSNLRTEALTVLYNDEGDYSREVCPTCEGAGRLLNPEGPERFDLMHEDGYALRSVWQ